MKGSRGVVFLLVSSTVPPTWKLWTHLLFQFASRSAEVRIGLKMETPPHKGFDLQTK